MAGHHAHPPPLFMCCGLQVASMALLESRPPTAQARSSPSMCSSRQGTAAASSSGSAPAPTPMRLACHSTRYRGEQQGCCWGEAIATGLRVAGVLIDRHARWLSFHGKHCPGTTCFTRQVASAFRPLQELASIPSLALHLLAGLMAPGPTPGPILRAGLLSPLQATLRAPSTPSRARCTACNTSE